jgi:Domain of unknown function (DUF6894)
MPRYYFHLLDERTANLVRDSAGTSLPTVNEVKREAIGLAQDIVRHQLHGSTWQVVVTDGLANVVFRLPFTKVRPPRFKAAFDRARGLALYEPRLQPRIFTWLLTVVLIAVIMESAMLSGMSGRASDPIEAKYGCRTR